MSPRLPQPPSQLSDLVTQHVPSDRDGERLRAQGDNGGQIVDLGVKEQQIERGLELRAVEASAVLFAALTQALNRR